MWRMRTRRPVVPIQGSAHGASFRYRRAPMAIERMDHVGIVVEDLAAATEFFVELGMELQGEGSGAGKAVDRIVGLGGVESDFAFLQTPDGHGKVELVKFRSPPAEDGNPQAPVNATGL